MPATGWNQYDPFLTHGSTRGQETKTRGQARSTAAPQKQRARGGRLGWKEIATLVLVPWLAFVGILACFALAYHHFPKFVWLAVVCSFALSAMYGVFGFLHEKRRLFLFAGPLCGVAVILGTFLGLHCYTQFLVQYYSSVGGNQFIDVVPSDKAGAYRDAGKILFTEEARVDASKSLGYKAGNMYCVAPILDETDAGTVEFWAVGMNCCGRRGYFSCDDAWSPEARGGMVIHDAEGFMKDRHDYYMAAIKEAEAAFDIFSADLPLLVRWVQDPDQVENDFFKTGFTIIGIAIAVHFVFSIVSTTAIGSSLTAD